MKAADAAQAQSVLLALWLGAAIFAVAVVAPAAFAALPTRALAGAVVGRVLPALFCTGIVVGIAVALLEWRVLEKVQVTSRSATGLSLAVACAIAQFVIGARIARARALIGGSLDALPADDPRRLAFGRLHGLSVLSLGLAAVAAAVALVLAIRTRRLTP